MIETNYNASSEELERNYLLDKSITDMYDITKTKEKVLEYIKDYKVARVKCLSLVAFESLSSSQLEENKLFSKTRSNCAKFETKIDDLLDSQEFVNIAEKILEKIKETFTKIERNYYELCLFSDYSEEYFKDYHSGGLSKFGVIPIKNSCILKIALAFGLEVLKWLVNNIYIVC